MTEALSLADIFTSQAGTLPADFTVTVVGKGNSHTGMGMLTHAWLHALSGVASLRFVNTRPEEGDDVSYAHVRNVTESEAHAKPGHVAIFTDVLWNGAGDRNYEKTPSAQLKYAYCAFDSTTIPPEWVSIINNHFDAAIVTARFLVDVFRSSGVAKPVFHLPVALDLDRFLTQPVKNLGSPYVFGVVGAYDFRKNIDLIAEAFEAEFGLDDPSVALRIKLTYSHLGEDAVTEFARRFRGTNVQIERGKIDREDYLGFLSGLDCIINLSRGEGYSIPVREGVALGKSLVLTSHFAHEDLAGLESAIFLKAEIPVPALYPQINERFFGLQYLPHFVEVKEALRDNYERRAYYFDRAVRNRSRAREWTVDGLKESYRSLALPRTMTLRGGDATVAAGGSATGDSYYYRRAADLYGSSVARSARNRDLLGIRRRKTVVMGHDGGFFSLFNKFVSYLVWEKDADRKHLVLPDWRAASIEEFFNLKGFTSFCYASPTEGNAWTRLFEPSPDLEGDAGIYNDPFRLYQDADIADDFNEHREPWLTYKNAFELYRMPEFRRWRKWYNGIVSEYCRPLPVIEKRVAHNLRSMGGGDRIGVHIRHPSHAIEQPGAKIAYVDSYVRAIENYISERRLLDPKIFLATDQESTLDAMVMRFGDRVYFDRDVKRTSRVHDAGFGALSKDQQMQEGHQIQHLTAADPKNWSSTMAVEVLADAYSLAGCDHFFHIVSNISTAVSYLNPSLEMVFVGRAP